MYRKIGFIFTVVVLELITIAGGIAAQRAGTLLTISGEARIRRDGRDQYIQPGMSVLGGDVIRTGKTGKAGVELIGGHIVNIGPDSEFEIDEPGAEKEDLTTAMLYIGSVYIRKRPTGDRTSHSFQLQTPVAVAGIRGTEVAVAVAPDNTVRFGVAEGNVEIETEQNKKIALGLRQGVIIGSSGSAPKVSKFDPERDNLDSWLDARKAFISKYPLPAATRLTLNLSNSITLGERIAREAAETTEKIISEAEAAQQEKAAGKTQLYSDHAKKIIELLPALVVRIRLLVRLDNMIQGRGKMLEWLVREATAPGSPSPQRAVKALNKHYELFRSLEARADKLHEARVKLLRERIPVMKELVQSMR